MQIYTANSTTHELRKAWRRGDNGPVQDEQVEGFRFAKDFIYEHHDVGDLSGFCDLLNRLADVPNASLVLGNPLIDRGGRTGLDFDDAPTNLCVADLDSLEFDGTPEQAVRFAFPFLIDREFVYAFSPSSGFKPGHRLRVAFEVEPMDLTMMQMHAEHWNAALTSRIGLDRKFVDYSIYKPSGFVFTARPRLEGLDDPHPVRAYHVDGIKGPVPIPRLPDMVEVDVSPAVNLGQMPTLKWDEGQRHISVFNFLVAYRTAFPDSVYTQVWDALSAEYERLGVSSSDRRAFGERYVQTRYQGITGARRKRKAFPVVRNELPADEAAAKIRREVRDFVREREPGVKVIEAEPSIGKTYQTLYWLGVEARYSREQTNDPFFIDFYVPNHKLSAQIEADARAHGLSAYTEFGRSQEVDGRKVCEKAEAIAKVQGIISETRKTFCMNDDAVCPHRTGCLWWDLHAKSMSYDLRIRTHAHLPLQIAKDSSYSRVPNFVVIDENFIGALVKQSYLDFKDLCDVTRHDMGEWMLKLHQVGKAGFTLDNLLAAGFTPDICRELIKAENALAPDIEITPDMSASDALTASTGYDGEWYKYASFWRRLRDCLDTGSLNRLRITPNKVGVFMNWRQKIAGIPWDHEENRPKVPVLILSATIKRSMVEAVMPVDEWVSIEVEKHADAKVTQVPLNASKSALLYGTGDRIDQYGETDKQQARAAQQLRDDIAQVAEGRHLFSYKALMDEGVPLSGWFNAVEGLNHWAGGKIDIVGRPLPEPTVIEDIARAIHQDGDPITTVGKWYPKRPHAFFGGKGMTWCERHIDPRAEDVRWVMCEGAMLQAAARARHVRQGCEIRLFTNMALPIKVDEVVPFDDLHPANREYADAPVRTTSPRLAAVLFRKFEGVPRSTIQQELGNVGEWAFDNEAQLIEIRLQGEKQWSRVLLASGGWRWLCDRVPVVAWRDASMRKDDDRQRFEAVERMSAYAGEVAMLREAFAREAWCDEDGVVPSMIVTEAGWQVDAGRIGMQVRAMGF